MSAGPKWQWFVPLIWWHKSKQLFFIPILLLFMLNSQCLGIKKPSSLALLPFPPLADLKEDNMAVVRMAANFGQGLMALTHIERDESRKKNEMSIQWSLVLPPGFMSGQP